MKKLLLAFLGLNIVSGAAYSDTSVSIYGLVDMGIVGESGGPNGSRTKLASGVFNGSRIGFKGNEDLGGGLSAHFTLENGYQADTGAMGQGGLIFGRQAFVGLSGGFGAVRFGRQYTAFDTVVGTADPFGAGGAGRNASVLGARNVAGVTGYYTNRINNNIMYSTPNWNGFSADVAYGLGEVAGNTSAGRFAGASVGYKQGPVYIRLAHQDLNNAAGTGSAKNTILGSSYDFGIATAYLAYAAGKTDNLGATLSDDHDLLLGVSVPVGAGKIMASYVAKRDKLASNDANLLAVGYMHSLSKRTRLYTAYGRISNKNAARYTVDSAIELGSGNKAYNLGIQHSF